MTEQEVVVDNGGVLSTISEEKGRFNSSGEEITETVHRVHGVRSLDNETVFGPVPTGSRHGGDSGIFERIIGVSGDSNLLNRELSEDVYFNIESNTVGRGGNIFYVQRMFNGSSHSHDSVNHVGRWGFESSDYKIYLEEIAETFALGCTKFNSLKHTNRSPRITNLNRAEVGINLSGKELVLIFVVSDIIPRKIISTNGKKYLKGIFGNRASDLKNQVNVGLWIPNYYWNEDVVHEIRENELYANGGPYTCLGRITESGIPQSTNLVGSQKCRVFTLKINKNMSSLQILDIAFLRKRWPLELSEEAMRVYLPNLDKIKEDGRNPGIYVSPIVGDDIYESGSLLRVIHNRKIGIATKSLTGVNLNEIGKENQHPNDRTHYNYLPISAQEIVNAAVGLATKDSQHVVQGNSIRHEVDEHGDVNGNVFSEKNVPESAPVEDDMGGNVGEEEINVVKHNFGENGATIGEILESKKEKTETKAKRKSSSSRKKKKDEPKQEQVEAEDSFQPPVEEITSEGECTLGTDEEVDDTNQSVFDDASELGNDEEVGDTNQSVFDDDDASELNPEINEETVIETVAVEEEEEVSI